jgi:Ser/Thr protein kinase RdoA (MazF antagonist)
MLSPQLRAVLDHWPETADAVQVSGVTPGFSGAGVFRITAASGIWCLRRWPTGDSGLPEGRIRELHRWLAFLAKEGISKVAVPVASNTGSTVVSTHGSQWQLEPWLPGVADFRQHPSDVRLRRVFTSLAQLHQAAERYSPSPAGATWFSSGNGVPPAIIERRYRLRQWMTSQQQRHRSTASAPQRELSDELNQALSALAPRIATELDQCEEIRVRLQPCLRDVWHDHILFTGDEVTGIVDPSAARTENVASDLSRLLGSLLAEAAERWETTLDAYAAVRPLSSDERRLIPVLDRSGIVLSTAHWLERMRDTTLTEREYERVHQLSQRLFALR